MTYNEKVWFWVLVGCALFWCGAAGMVIYLMGVPK